MGYYNILTFILTFITFGSSTADIDSHIPLHDYTRIIKHIEQTAHIDNHIIIAHNVESDMNSILQYTTKPVFLINLNKTINAEQISERYNMFVIIIKYIEDFNTFLNLFTSFDTWNKRGTFCVLFSGKEQFEDIFRISWKNYIVGINVFIWNYNEINVYTYFPYKGNNCGNNITAELLGKYPVDDLFPPKIPLTFHGCPIEVLIDRFAPCILADDFTTDDSKKVGFEIVLLKNVLQHMDLIPSTIFKPEIILGTKLPNNEFDGLLQYLKNETCEIMIGHLWPKLPFFSEYFDISYPYYLDDIYWYVPKASLGDKWKSLYLIFTIAMWLSILAICAFNILVWSTFTRFINDIAELKSMRWCVLETWRGLLQGSFKLPNSGVMRILVITWSFIGFILASAYQSQLLSILTTPIYKHQISTLEELADSSLFIPHAGFALDSYKNSTVGNERRIFAKAQFYPLTEFINYIRNYSSQIAFAGSAARVRHNHLLYYMNPDGTSKIYEIRKSVQTVYICMYTRRGYPLLDRINNIVILFLENGLFYKWIKDTEELRDMKSDNEPEKLGLNHLQGIFSLWLLGILLSSLIFIVEVLISIKNKRRDR